LQEPRITARQLQPLDVFFFSFRAHRWTEYQMTSY